MDDISDRTEAPSTRRIAEAREQGHVARSRYANTVVLGMVVLAGISVTGRSTGRQLLLWLRDSLTSPVTHGFATDHATMAIRSRLVSISALIVPLLIMAGIAVLLVGMLQTGWLFSPGVLLPRANRLSPWNAWERMFGIRSLARSVVGVLGLAAAVTVGGQFIVSHAGQLAAMSRLPLNDSAAQSLQLLTELATWLIVGITPLAVIDYLMERHFVNSSLRMTQQDIRDEARRLNPNAATLGRRQRQHRESQRAEPFGGLRGASVIVYADQSCAVALRFEPGSMITPTLIARARGLSAATVRELASRYDLPVVEDTILARQIFFEVERGQAVPSALAEHCADIFTFARVPHDETSHAATNHWEL